MTIKELEQKTGMTRANIRFYEGEGLLAPKRLDNGYRDYSEEDLRTLEKIRLLRQLQLDIDTIRKVQAGTLTLEQALFTQLTRLEGDRAVIERAATVCRELERSGVEYASLDPQPWLTRLQPPQRPGLTPPSAVPAEDVEEDGEPRACAHPWRRLFARGLDMALYDTLINGAWLLLFRDQSFLRLQTGNVVVRWLWGAAMLALALALEPLWLHFWGWTPGKWLFGLKLRGEDGEKLTLAQAWERSWRVAWEGYGWNIPIWSLWRMWQGRAAGLEGRDCHWDGEEDYRYTKVERNYDVLAFIAVRAALPGLLVLAMLFTALPPCRGDLTVAEFSRNYDHFLRLLYPAGEYGYLPTLDGEGRWKDRPQSGGVAVHHGSGISVSADGQVWIVEEPETIPWDQPEFTVENGRVTAVTLRWESSQAYLFSNGEREVLAVLAMSGAVDGLNLFNFDVDGWGKMVRLMLAPWGDVEADYRGLHISQELDYSGYQEQGTFLFATDGERQHCRWTLTISLAE